MTDSADFANARFMESFESRHSDHSFTKRLSDAVGIVVPPLRLDSQAKYGAHSSGSLCEVVWRLRVLPACALQCGHTRRR